MSSQKLILKRVQALVTSGLKQLWDREVDSFAIGLGEDEDVLDTDRDVVIARIMARLETAVMSTTEKVKPKQTKDEAETEDDEVDEVETEVEDNDEAENKDADDADDEVDDEPIVKAKKAAKAMPKKAKKAKSKEDKPKRAPSMYNAFVKYICDKWKKDNPDADIKQLEGGMMGYAGKMWEKSFMNKKNPNYDEEKANKIRKSVTESSSNESKPKTKESKKTKDTVGIPWSHDQLKNCSLAELKTVAKEVDASTSGNKETIIKNILATRLSMYRVKYMKKHGETICTPELWTKIIEELENADTDIDDECTTEEDNDDDMVDEQ